MAKRSGLSQSAISRIWRAFALQPHRAETFKLSTDPLFVEKVRDIVGLYLKPPDKALVLCVDEKSGIQALDRTAPLLPMRPGQIERRTHDYSRHGTTDLFGAIARSSSAISSTRSMPRYPLSWMSTSSWTTLRPTRRRIYTAGWPSVPATISTSLLPVPPGSISLSDGSPR